MVSYDANTRASDYKSAKKMVCGVYEVQLNVSYAERRIVYCYTIICLAINHRQVTQCTALTARPRLECWL